jgi:hypothetical protein
LADHLGVSAITRKTHKAKRSIRHWRHWYPAHEPIHTDRAATRSQSLPGLSFQALGQVVSHFDERKRALQLIMVAQQCFFIGFFN